MSAIQAGGDTLRIGIDVGGTKIAGVLLAEAADGDARPKLLAERSIPARPGAEQLVDDVVSVVGALTKDAPGRRGHRNDRHRHPGHGRRGDRRGREHRQPRHRARRARRRGRPAHRRAHPCRERRKRGCPRRRGHAAADRRRRRQGHRRLPQPRHRTGGRGDPRRRTGPRIQQQCRRNRACPGRTAPLALRLRTARLPRNCGHRRVAAPDHAQAAETLDTIVSAIADAIDIAATAIDPRSIIIGGGMAKTGRPLLDCITTELRRREETSRFVASLRLPDRLSLTDPDQPIGAIGAALAGRGAI